MSDADDLIYYFHSTMSRELLHLVIGEKLGQGADREVYVYRPHPEYVVKVETGGEGHQNAVEWEVWNEAKGTPLERWLAPCTQISPYGGMLLQMRTRRPPDKSYPARLPSIFTDTKRDNYGVLPNGRFVCHDYGMLMLLCNQPTRLRKVEWWEV